MADRLGSTPHEPGDLVRDPKTNWDYVIQSVTLIAGVGGVVVYGIHLWQGATQTWSAKIYEDLQFKTLRLNKEKLTPDEVVNQIRRKLADVVNNRSDFLAALMKESDDTRIFRDLLLLTSDVDENSFRRGMVELAEALVDYTKAVPTEGQIFDLLRNNIDPDIVPDERIREFAKELANKAGVAGRASRLPSLTGDDKVRQLTEAFFDRGHKKNAASVQNSVLNVIRESKLNSESLEGKKSAAYRWLTSEYLGTKAPIDETVSTSSLLKKFATRSDTEKVATLAREALIARGVRNAEEVVETPFMREVINKAVAASKTGKINPLLSMIASSLEGVHINVPEPPVFMGPRGTEWVQKHLRPFYNHNARPIRRNFGSLRPDISFDLLTSVGEGVERANFVSVDSKTFLKTVIGTDPVILGGRTTQAGSTDFSPLLREVVGEDPGVFHFSPAALEEFSKTRDLDVLLRHSRKVDSLLEINSKHAIEELFGTHGDGGFVIAADNPRAVVWSAEKQMSEEILQPSLDEIRQISKTPIEALENFLQVPPPAEGLSRLYFGVNSTGETLFATNPEGLYGNIDAFLGHVDVDLPSLNLSERRFGRLSAGEAVGGIHIPKSDRSYYRDLLNLQEAGRATTVEEVLNIASSENVTAHPYQALVEARIHGNLEGSINGARINRLSEVKITQGDNRIWHALLNSDVDAPLNEQLSRARKLLSGNGALLDIETRQVNGGTVVEDISLGRYREGKYESLVEWNPGLSEAENIRNVANRLGDVDVIGTHTGFDLRNLSARARVLGMSQEAELLGQASASKAIDTRLIFQATGSRHLNQQDLMFEASRKAQEEGRKLSFTSDQGIELHRARADNADMAVLLHERSKDFHATTIESVESPWRIGTHSSLGSEYGSIRRLIGVEEDALSGNISAVFQAGSIQGDEIIPGAILPEQVFENTSLLSHRINNLSMAIDSTNIEEAVLRSRKAADERASRWFSSLGPFSRSQSVEFDVLEGVVGATTLRAEEEVRVALPRAMEALGPIPTTAAGIQERSRRILLLADEFAGGVELSSFGKQSFREGLIAALIDPSRAEDYLGGFKGQFLTSEAGRQLLSLAADDSMGAGNMFMLGMSNLQARLASDVDSRMTALSNPRLSFKFGRIVQGANLEGGSLIHLKSSIEEMTAAILLGLADSGRISQEEAFDLVKKAIGANNVEMDEITSLAQQYIQRKGMSRSTNEAYRRGLGEIGFIGKDDPLHRLAVYFGRLRDSETLLHEVVLPSIREATNAPTAESLIAHILGSEGSTPTRVQLAFQKLLIEGGPEALTSFRQEIEILDVDRINNLAQGLEVETRALAGMIGDPSAVNPIAVAAIEAREAEYRAGNKSNQPVAAWDAIQERTGEAWARLRAAKVGAPGVTSTAADSIKAVHTEGLNYATSVADRKGLIKTAHLISRDEAAAIGKKIFNRYTAPLLAIGGALALLSARTPSTHKQPGEDSPVFAGLGEQLASSAEQTSGGAPPAVWHGEEQPFRMGISFKGFVANKYQRELFVREVHNILSNHLEVKRVNSHIQDKRNQTHTMAALDAMRDY